MNNREREKNRELAWLMGWTKCTKQPPFHSREFGERCWFHPLTDTHRDGLPNYYGTNMQDIREVWVELWKRGVWSKFLWETCGFEAETPGELLAADIYLFLDDLPGQVNNAIRVMKE